MNRWLWLCGLLVLAGALWLRLPGLDRRPMHNDEATNASLIQGLWERGTYQYDPHEYHGPSLYYATLPFLWLSRPGNADEIREATLRLMPVFFGTALILLFWLVADGLGRAATLWAGLLAALSPAMVFYSRYFIHEMPLVCFTMVLLGFGWRYARTGCIGCAMLAGAGLGLMYATKETFVLNLFALGVAAMAVWFLQGKQGNSLAKLRPHLKPALAALAVAAVVSLLLFTSFFTNLAGPLDSIRTYLPWLHRAGGQSPHIHPWNFYLERLVYFHPARSPVWSEGLILVLAVAGMVAAFTRKGLAAGASPALAQFLSVYTLVLTAAYSAISYKTPWCLLNFLLGMILLAGIGAVALLHWVKYRALQGAVVCVLLAAAGHLGWQAWRATHAFEADRRNPYVYAHTSANLLELIQKVNAIAAVHPEKNRLLLKVISKESYWPLPWYLRQFKQVGWYDQMPADPYAPIVIAGASFGAELDEKSKKAWLMPGLFELRPGVFLELYVQFDLWKKIRRVPPAAEG